MTPESCSQCGARVINRTANQCWRCGVSFTGEEPASEASRTEPSEAIAAGPPPNTSEAISAGPPTSPSDALAAGSSPVRPPKEEPTRDNPALAVMGLLLLFPIVNMALANAIDLAFVLVLVATPALTRVVYFSLQRAYTGKRSLTVGEIVLLFFTSLGVVTITEVAFAIAFVAIFSSIILVGSLFLSGTRYGIDPGWIFVIAFVSGLITGIVVLVNCIRYFWSK